MNGELEQTGNRWSLCFTRHLRQPPELVWRAITEAEHLEQWFPDRIVGELTPGAALRFEHEWGDPFDGEVMTVDPPRLLEFRWGTDMLRFEIEPEGDGSILTLIDTFDELGKAARDAAGWHECLDRLTHHLDPAAPVERWSDLNDRYAEKFGPEAATIGPPPEYTASQTAE